MGACGRQFRPCCLPLVHLRGACGFHSSARVRERLLADRGERGAGRDRLGIDLEVDDRGLAGCAARPRTRPRNRRSSPRSRRSRRRRAHRRRNPDSSARSPTMRPGYSRSWCMRMVPYMPLSTITMMIGRSYCTAVANSCPFIRKSPSPAKHTTVRSGWRRFIADRGRHAVAHRARGRRRAAWRTGGSDRSDAPRRRNCRRRCR